MFLLCQTLPAHRFDIEADVTASEAPAGVHQFADIAIPS